MGHPVIGDPVYGRRGDAKRLAQANPDLVPVVRGIQRQMLHAWKLRINHPKHGRALQFEARLPADMAGLIGRFRDHLRQG
jgi:23S rRNA pseudouridine1911/1915/1917 synthase